MSAAPPRRRPLVGELVAELKRQNAALSASRARQAHLDLLSHPELGVVVTGQQVGLFLGPAYTLYKAATAIDRARRIGEQTGRPTVPIFWLQSEDHDADEVASCGVLDAADALVRVSLAPSGAVRASMAHRELGAGVEAALAELAAYLGDAPETSSCLALLARSYEPRTSWVHAFAGALGQVFAEEGLLVLDPRTPAIAELARPVHRRAFEQAAAIDAELEARSRELEAAGQPLGVRLRPGCSLSFFHPDGPEGSRFRLQREGDDRWRIPGRDATLATRDVLAALEREPLAFSTSSLLRVVLQDHLLPTVALVAGPGEARYLRQVAPLAARYGLAPPAVVPRARFAVTDARTRRALAALGIEAAAIERGAEAVLHDLAGGDPGPSGSEIEARIHGAVLRELEACSPDLVAIDPALRRALDRTSRHVARGAARLGARIERARSRRDRLRLERVELLARRLYPGDAPQERALSFPHFAARFGIEALKSALFAALARRSAPHGELEELAL